MAVNSYRDDEQLSHTSRKKILRRLLKYLLVYKGAVCGVLLIMAVTIGISLINPLLIEEALDHYVAESDMDGLVKLGAAALLMNIVFIILVKLRMYIMSVISNKILLVIRQDLYEHIQTLSFSFFDSRPTGKILARIIGDVNALKDVFVNSVTTLNSRIYYCVKCCGNHGGKGLPAGGGLALYNSAYGRGRMDGTEGDAQPLAAVPEKVV